MVSGLVWWSPLISFWWGASSTDWHWPLGGDEDEELTIFIIISVLVVEDDGENDFSRLNEKPRLVGSKNAKYFFSELLFCRTSLKIFACAWPLAIHAFDLCFKRIEKKMDRAPLPPHLHMMALFSYNNYPHLWFLLGRPGGQGGNISLWAIASKHNEEQSKSIIFISSDWSRQKDKFAKFPFVPISFLSLPHLYLLPLCQPSHLSKH